MDAENPYDHEHLPRYKIEDWELWEGQWELINGIAWAMSTAPGSNHQALNLALAMLFSEKLKDCSRCKVYLPVDLKINEMTVLQPDISIVCDGPAEFTKLEKVPALVVEILSPKTATKDLNVKPGQYAAIGVKHYLIAHPVEQWIRVMELQNEDWKIVAEDRDFKFDFDLGECKFSADFGSCWPSN